MPDPSRYLQKDTFWTYPKDAFQTPPKRHILDISKRHLPDIPQKIPSEHPPKDTYWTPQKTPYRHPQKGIQTPPKPPGHPQKHLKREYSFLLKVQRNAVLVRKTWYLESLGPWPWPGNRDGDDQCSALSSCFLFIQPGTSDPRMELPTVRADLPSLA